MIKYIGFDKDGTLINSMPSYAKTWGDILHKEFDLNREEARKYLLETSGQSTFTQTDHLLKKHGIILSNDEIFELSNQIAEDLAVEDNSGAFSDVPEALALLREHGYKIFISSNQQEDVIERDIKRTNLDSYIDYYAGIKPEDETFRKGKPHFLAAARHFNVDFATFIKETIFIGDTRTDLDIANSLGVPCIIRKSSNFGNELLELGAKFVVEDFVKLPQLIELIN